MPPIVAASLFAGRQTDTEAVHSAASRAGGKSAWAKVWLAYQERARNDIAAEDDRPDAAAEAREVNADRGARRYTRRVSR